MTVTDEGRRLLEGATPGPWRNGVVTGFGIYGNHPDPSALATVRHWEPSKEPMDERAKADAALIVWLRNRSDYFLTAVEALERLGEQHHSLSDHNPGSVFLMRPAFEGLPLCDDHSCVAARAALAPFTEEPTDGRD